MTLLESLCLHEYLPSHPYSSFFLLVVEVQQIPIMPVSGAKTKGIK